MSADFLFYILLFASSIFYFDALINLTLLTNPNQNKTLYIEPSYNTTSISLYELIDHCVTNYFIVFQNCFIFAFGTTCFIIQNCVWAYFLTIDYVFSYLTTCADHILVFPNSILVFLLIILFMNDIKKNNNIIENN